MEGGGKLMCSFYTIFNISLLRLSPSAGGTKKRHRGRDEYTGRGRQADAFFLHYIQYLLASFKSLDWWY